MATSTETKLRRGTATQCDAMTPAEGELIVDLTNDRTRLGDGLVAGGLHQASAVDVQNCTLINGTVGGTANAITLTNYPTVKSYVSGLGLKFKATATNTGATTVNVDGLGAKNIYKISSGALGALVAGDIVSGGVYTLHYDGTQFQLGSGGAGNAGTITSITAGAGLSGGTITSSGTITINTNNYDGVGAYAMMKILTSVSNNTTIAGSSLQYVCFGVGAGGTFVPSNTGATPSGTWRNVTGVNMSTGTDNPAYGIFIRTA